MHGHRVHYPYCTECIWHVDDWYISWDSNKGALTPYDWCVIILDYVLCCNRLHDQEQFGQKDVHFSLQVRVHHTGKLRQKSGREPIGRNWSRDYGGMQFTSLVPMAQLYKYSYITLDYITMMVPATVGWAIMQQPQIKTIPDRHTHRPIWSSNFSVQDSESQVRSFCQDDITSTLIQMYSHLFVKVSRNEDLLFNDICSTSVCKPYTPWTWTKHDHFKCRIIECLQYTT